MKRIIPIFLVITVLVSLVACGTAGKEDNPLGNTVSNATGVNSQTGDDSGSNGQAADNTAENASLDGTLHFITLDDRDPSVLRGVSFAGNRSGTAEFNSKPAATSGIRCIFELNEYVSAIPDTDITEGLNMYILQHRDDQSTYEAAQFSDSMDGFVFLYALKQDGDPNFWGDFYLNPEEVAPGYYDFVFVYEGKAIATMLTRFYNEAELEGRTDAELEALMYLTRHGKQR